MGDFGVVFKTPFGGFRQEMAHELLVATVIHQFYEVLFLLGSIRAV
ncbi:hypothetical protein [Arthrobacter sp. 35/47]|nr:hypothetical protein [Arthrobacter sp. 35/47]